MNIFQLKSIWKLKLIMLLSLKIGKGLLQNNIIKHMLPIGSVTHKYVLCQGHNTLHLLLKLTDNFREDIN